MKRISFTWYTYPTEWHPTKDMHKHTLLQLELLVEWCCFYRFPFVSLVLSSRYTTVTIVCASKIRLPSCLSYFRFFSSFFYGTRIERICTNSMVEKEGFNEVAIEPLRQFTKDSMHLVKKCTKPDRKEFLAIAKAVGVGFSIMGFIGFFVKLVHIPINNILVGG